MAAALQYIMKKGSKFLAAGDSWGKRADATRYGSKNTFEAARKRLGLKPADVEMVAVSAPKPQRTAAP